MALRSGEIANLHARVGLKTDDAKRGADELQSLLSGLVGAFKVAAGALAIGATVRAGWRELAQDMRLAAEESAGIASLGQAIRNTGADWAQASEEIERYLAAETKRTALDDGAGRESIARLTEATGDYRTALALLPLAQDMARAKKMDLVAASELLSRVAAGNVAMLTRYGIILDENATAEEAIAELRRRYAGQAEAYAETQLGQQERMNIALGNIRETVGGGLNPAMTQFYSLAATALEGILPMVERAAGAFSGMLLGWTREIAGFARDAAYWGANIVDQFASGIMGSDAVSRALRNMGDEIAAWLEPGSPPKLLPDLDEWGRGAAAAYFEGWADASSDVAAYLQDMAKSLRPYLQEVDLTGTFSEDAQRRLRAAFGASGIDPSGYMGAYAAVAVAAKETAEAQSAFDEAVESGDEQAIEGAKERLSTAKQAENAARERMRQEQQALTQRIEAEMRLARAAEERNKREADAAIAAAKREEEAEARRAAAEAKQLHDARLRYELSLADTASQIAIWQRELEGLNEGQAEYWDILTRIVGLQKELGREGAASGLAARALPEGWGADAVADAQAEAEEAAEGQRIDWAGIGARIGQALIDGAKAEIMALPQKMVDATEALKTWAASEEAQTELRGIGNDIGDWVVAGITALFTSDETRDAYVRSIATGLANAVLNMRGTLALVGSAIAAGIMDSFAEALGLENPDQWGNFVGQLSRFIMMEGWPTGGFGKGPDMNKWDQYDTGGVVPGPIGAPRLAIVHGGELVLTPEQQRQRGGVNITIGTINAPAGQVEQVRRGAKLGVQDALRAAGMA